MAEQSNHILEPAAIAYVEKRVHRLRRNLLGHTILARGTEQGGSLSERIVFSKEASLDVDVRYPGRFKGVRALTSAMHDRALINYWSTNGGSYGLKSYLPVAIADKFFTGGVAVHLRAADTGEWANLALTDATMQRKDHPEGNFDLEPDHYFALARFGHRGLSANGSAVVQYGDFLMDASQQLEVAPEEFLGFMLETPEHQLLMAKGALLGVRGGITVTDTTAEVS